MKRTKKLINSIIILSVVSFCIIFFGNFYFSEDKCLEEIKKSLYLEDYEVLGAYNIDGKIRYTLIHHEDKSFYRLTIDKTGPLYRYYHIYGNEIFKMDDENSIDIKGILYNDSGNSEVVYVIYRNDERVKTIETQNPNGNIEMCKEWNGNFCIFINENVTVFTAQTHYVYDENKELIEVISY